MRADGFVEYVAELHEAHIHPSESDRKTVELLAHALEATEGEGLWDEDVETPYTISNCRRLKEPFPMTRLIKVSDGAAISKNYNYSYCMVYSR
jgi:hypothetical protein